MKNATMLGTQLEAQRLHPWPHILVDERSLEGVGRGKAEPFAGTRHGEVQQTMTTWHAMVLKGVQNKFERNSNQILSL